VNKRGDQVLQLLRHADPAPAAPDTADAAQAAADYRRLLAAIEAEAPATTVPARRRRPPAAALAAACCALILAAFIGFLVHSAPHRQSQPGPEVPPVNFSLTVNGTAYRFNQTVPVVAGRTYAISVRVAIAPGAHFTAFQLIVAGNGSGVSGGGPTGNFDSVATIAQPRDSFTVNGTWKARPMGGPAWIEAVYATTDAHASIGTGRTLAYLQVR
jgi:hypothetical protein